MMNGMCGGCGGCEQCCFHGCNMQMDMGGCNMGAEYYGGSVPGHCHLSHTVGEHSYGGYRSCGALPHYGCRSCPWSITSNCSNMRCCKCSAGNTDKSVYSLSYEHPTRDSGRKARNGLSDDEAVTVASAKLNVESPTPAKSPDRDSARSGKPSGYGTESIPSGSLQEGQNRYQMASFNNNSNNNAGCCNSTISHKSNCNPSPCRHVPSSTASSSGPPKSPGSACRNYLMSACPCDDIRDGNKFYAGSRVAGGGGGGTEYPDALSRCNSCGGCMPCRRCASAVSEQCCFSKDGVCGQSGNQPCCMTTVCGYTNAEAYGPRKTSPGHNRISCCPPDACAGKEERASPERRICFDAASKCPARNWSSANTERISLDATSINGSRKGIAESERFSLAAASVRKGSADAGKINFGGTGGAYGVKDERGSISSGRSGGNYGQAGGPGNGIESMYGFPSADVYGHSGGPGAIVDGGLPSVVNGGQPGSSIDGGSYGPKYGGIGGPVGASDIDSDDGSIVRKVVQAKKALENTTIQQLLQQQAGEFADLRNHQEKELRRLQEQPACPTLHKRIERLLQKQQCEQLQMECLHKRLQANWREANAKSKKKTCSKTCQPYPLVDSEGVILCRRADGSLLDKNGRQILGRDGQPFHGPGIGPNGQPMTNDDNIIVDQLGNILTGPDGNPIFAPKIVPSGQIILGPQAEIIGANGRPIIGPDGKPISPMKSRAKDSTSRARSMSPDQRDDYMGGRSTRSSSLGSQHQPNKKCKCEGDEECPLYENGRMIRPSLSTATKPSGISTDLSFDETDIDKEMAAATRQRQMDALAAAAQRRMDAEAAERAATIQRDIDAANAARQRAADAAAINAIKKKEEAAAEAAKQRTSDAIAAAQQRQKDAEAAATAAALQREADAAAAAKQRAIDAAAAAEARRNLEEAAAAERARQQEMLAEMEQREHELSQAAIRRREAEALAMAQLKRQEEEAEEASRRRQEERDAANRRREAELADLAEKRKNAELAASEAARKRMQDEDEAARRRQEELEAAARRRREEEEHAAELARQRKEQEALMEAEKERAAAAAAHQRELQAAEVARLRRQAEEEAAAEARRQREEDMEAEKRKMEEALEEARKKREELAAEAERERRRQEAEFEEARKKKAEEEEARQAERDRKRQEEVKRQQEREAAERQRKLDRELKAQQEEDARQAAERRRQMELEEAEKRRKIEMEQAEKDRQLALEKDAERAQKVREAEELRRKLQAQQDESDEQKRREAEALKRKMMEQEREEARLRAEKEAEWRSNHRREQKNQRNEIFGCPIS